MIDELAQSQAGALARGQLVAHGTTRRCIEANLSAQRRYDGVYVAFTGPLPRLTEIWTAILAAGPGAVASHQTAAEIWGLTGRSSTPIHVSIPTVRGAVAPTGIRLHRSRYLPATRDPVRSPPRTRLDATIVDLVASATRFAELVDWLTAGCQQRRTTPDRLLAEIRIAQPRPVAARGRGNPGGRERRRADAPRARLCAAGWSPRAAAGRAAPLEPRQPTTPTPTPRDNGRSGP